MRNSRHGDLRTLMTSRRNGNILWLAKHSGILFTSPLIITIASPHIALDSCYPTFLLKKKELEQARQPYLFYARKKQLYALQNLVSWLFQLCPRRPAPEARRRNLWCLSGPAEKLSHWYRPSARDSTYDWHNCRSFLSILAECLSECFDLIIGDNIL